MHNVSAQLKPVKRHRPKDLTELKLRQSDIAVCVHCVHCSPLKTKAHRLRASCAMLSLVPRSVIMRHPTRLKPTTQLDMRTFFQTQSKSNPIQGWIQSMSRSLQSTPNLPSSFDPAACRGWTDMFRFSSTKHRSHSLLTPNTLYHDSAYRLFFDKLDLRILVSSSPRPVLDTQHTCEPQRSGETTHARTIWAALVAWS